MKILIIITTGLVMLWLANTVLQVIEIKVCSRSTAEQRIQLHCDEVLK